MKYVILASIIFAAGYNVAFGAEQAAQPAPVQAAAQSQDQPAEAQTEEIQLPAKDTPEYWNVRSEAITELLPFLTKKRSDVKKLSKVLADYILKNNLGADFSAQNIPVTYDSEIYAEILQIGPGLKDMNIPAPKSRPSWDEIMEIAMKHVIFEGYLPTAIEEGDDLKAFVDMCKKKEEYGQKVRQDGRTTLDQCARVWVFLKSINKKDEFKAYYADLKMEQKAQMTAQQKAMLEQRQMERRDRVAEQEQQQFDNKMDRAQFRSSRKERMYNSYQDQLLYRQSRLDERYTNSRAYYY